MGALNPAQFRPISKESYGLEGSHIDYAHTVANFVNTARDFLPKAKQAHVEFYDQHHKTAKKVGHGDPEKGAGMLSALSPSTPWEDNVDQAMELSGGHLRPEQFEHMRATGDRSVLKGSKLGSSIHPIKNILKAHDIHQGTRDPRESFEEPKTKNFQRALADPNDPNAMVIDYRMHDVGIGQELPTKTNRRIRGGRYDYLASAAHDAADQMNMSGPEFQSLVWHASRDSYGKKRGE